jgi:hypothetical protein
MCRMKNCWFILALSLCGACSSGSNISEQIESQFKASEATSVNLAVVGPASWDRVCVLRPYTDNQRTGQVLGLKWDSEAKTSIAESDGINVLVFVQGKEVVAHTEHPRSKGDFSQLQPQCNPRSMATVTRKVGSGGWVYLVAAQ